MAVFPQGWTTSSEFHGHARYFARVHPVPRPVGSRRPAVALDVVELRAGQRRLDPAAPPAPGWSAVELPDGQLLQFAADDATVIVGRQLLAGTDAPTRVPLAALLAAASSRDTVFHAVVDIGRARVMRLEELAGD